MEALSAGLPAWVQHLGDRRRLERAWLAWRLVAIKAGKGRLLKQLEQMHEREQQKLQEQGLGGQMADGKKQQHWEEQQQQQQQSDMWGAQWQLQQQEERQGYQAHAYGWQQAAAQQQQQQQQQQLQQAQKKEQVEDSYRDWSTRVPLPLPYIPASAPLEDPAANFAPPTAEVPALYGAEMPRAMPEATEDQPSRWVHKTSIMPHDGNEVEEDALGGGKGDIVGSGVAGLGADVPGLATAAAREGIGGLPLAALFQRRQQQQFMSLQQQQLQEQRQQQQRRQRDEQQQQLQGGQGEPHRGVKKVPGSKDQSKLSLRGASKAKTLGDNNRAMPGPQQQQQRQRQQQPKQSPKQQPQQQLKGVAPAGTAVQQRAVAGSSSSPVKSAFGRTIQAGTWVPPPRAKSPSPTKAPAAQKAPAASEQQQGRASPEGGNGVTRNAGLVTGKFIGIGGNLAAVHQDLLDRTRGMFMAGSDAMHPPAQPEVAEHIIHASQGQSFGASAAAGAGGALAEEASWSLPVDGTASTGGASAAAVLPVAAPAWGAPAAAAAESSGSPGAAAAATPGGAHGQPLQQFAASAAAAVHKAGAMALPLLGFYSNQEPQQQLQQQYEASAAAASEQASQVLQSSMVTDGLEPEGVLVQAEALGATGPAALQQKIDKYQAKLQSLTHHLHVASRPGMEHSKSSSRAIAGRSGGNRKTTVAAAAAGAEQRGFGRAAVATKSRKAAAATAPPPPPAAAVHLAQAAAGGSAVQTLLSKVAARAVAVPLGHSSVPSSSAGLELPHPSAQAATRLSQEPAGSGAPAPASGGAGGGRDGSSSAPWQVVGQPRRSEVLDWQEQGLGMRPGLSSSAASSIGRRGVSPGGTSLPIELLPTVAGQSAAAAAKGSGAGAVGGAWADARGVGGISDLGQQQGLAYGRMVARASAPVVPAAAAWAPEAAEGTQNAGSTVRLQRAPSLERSDPRAAMRFAADLIGAAAAAARAGAAAARASATATTTAATAGPVSLLAAPSAAASSRGSYAGTEMRGSSVATGAGGGQAGVWGPWAGQDFSLGMGGPLEWKGGLSTSRGCRHLRGGRCWGKGQGGW